jgi:hypothetical protein
MIFLIISVRVVFGLFLLVRVLNYYQQWKKSRRPLLSGSPSRGWHLHQLQHASTNASLNYYTAIDTSPNYYMDEGEVEILSELEEDRSVRGGTLQV